MAASLAFRNFRYQAGVDFNLRPIANINLEPSIGYDELMSSAAIDKFRDGLDPEVRATVDALRTLIAASHEKLVESIKWNAPSFAHHGEHRITLGLERAGGVRVVLHRGAKVKDSTAFHFDDPHQLARWPEPDRGVLLVRHAEDVTINGAALGELFRRWIVATA